VQTLTLRIIAFLMLAGVSSFSQLSAQNITGTWQGEIQPPQGKGLRVVINVSTTDADKLSAVAFQQQLGLKLEHTKAQVDVIVIDRLEKRSEN